MTSVTDICNIALSRIGHGQITDFDSDTTKAGDICRLQYPICRDTLLRMHPWNFAIKRVSLALSATTPVFEYTYAFAMPTDCLKIVRTSWEANGWSNKDDATREFWAQPSIPYRIEGGFLLCNDDTAIIEYVAKITDPAQYDAMFVDVLAQRLAAEIAMNLTDNQSFTKTAWDMYAIKLNEARTIDAQEGSARDIVDDSAWLQARH
jgi:hypothetical protein